MTDDELLAELRAAFPPKRIDASTAFEQRGRLYCDGLEVAALLHGKTWEEIDGTAFSRRSDSLHFLGDDHIRAVLPRALYLLVVLGPMSALGDMSPHYLRRKASSDRHVTNLERRSRSTASGGSGSSSASYTPEPGGGFSPYFSIL